MSTDAHTLPACQKCKLRKVKCDRLAPKCGSCTKGNVACIVIDQTTGEQYARDYVRVLEEQEARLRKQVEDGGGVVDEIDVESMPMGPPTGGSAASHGGFVGDGSGLGFLHKILSEATWQRHRSRILSQLAVRPRISPHHITPNAIPPLQEAEKLLDNYFTRFHIHHTFLLRHDVLDVFGRVYDQSEPHAAMPQDYFRLLMVFAISATTMYRAGLCSEHPYGYFIAAEKYLNNIPLVRGLHAIENLLLVARFGMYHHIGTSLWEISQVCIRQCIELRLHKKSLRSLEPLAEQHQRRIFWECYVLDRYSSGILGRPFAIAEEEISVPLPIDMYDDHISNSGAVALDHIPQQQGGAYTEISIFISFIKLRRISSRIHTTFYTERKSSSVKSQSVGQIYVSFTRFNNELDMWRMSVPAFSNPRSLYERTEWHDFMYHKDMLLLARGAMHSLPSTAPAVSSVTKEIFRACYTSASQVIYLYEDLMNKRAITWTRSYFQVIFAAGLTVTYCVSLKMRDTESNDFIVQDEAIETLNRCSRVLSHFKEKMPDAGSFAVVFDLLREECMYERGARQVIAHNREAQSVPTTLPTLQTGSIDPNLMQLQGDVQVTDFLPDQHNPHVDAMDLSSYDLNFNLTEDLMSHLEAGIGEYAWGSLQNDNDFWDQFPLV